MTNTYAINGSDLVNLLNTLIKSATCPIDNGADTVSDMNSVVTRLRGIGRGNIKFILFDQTTGQNFMDNEFHSHVSGHYDHMRNYIASIQMPANTDGVDIVQLVIRDYDGVLNPEVAANIGFMWLLRSYGYYNNIDYLELENVYDYGMSRAICFWNLREIDNYIYRIVSSWFSRENLISDSNAF